MVLFYVAERLKSSDHFAVNFLISYDIRFNCCNATRPILNKAQEAAANSGNKTTRSLVSAIKVNFCLQYIKYFLFEYYYTSFITLVLKTRREFFFYSKFL